MDFNNIGRILERQPEELLDLVDKLPNQLKYLSLSNNCLEDAFDKDTAIEYLFNLFHALPKGLKYLDLSKNNIVCFFQESPDLFIELMSLLPPNLVKLTLFRSHL